MATEEVTNTQIGGTEGTVGVDPSGTIEVVVTSTVEENHTFYGSKGLLRYGSNKYCIHTSTDGETNS